MQDLRKAFDRAKSRRETGKGTLLFIDEIHRFNRSQQDSFLPHMEDGTITLVGATTENPSFELNGALLSRALVLVFHRLDEAALERLLARAEQEEGRPLPLDAEARETLKAMGDGDGRTVFNMAEEVYGSVATGATAARTARGLTELVQRRAPLYDKSRDGHYNLISALHKSVRGSDPDAALYWLARMLDGGEDRLYVARRLVRMAIEDIGLADPQAVSQALAAKETFDFLGSPEGELALAQTVVYLATAPKSNAAYVAFGAAMRAAKEGGSLAPPKHILNAPTRLMKEEGYGAGYDYDHEAPGGVLGPELFPRRHGAPAVLRSRRPRLRGRDQGAAGGLGQAAREAGWVALRLGQTQRGPNTRWAALLALDDPAAFTRFAGTTEQDPLDIASESIHEPRQRMRRLLLQIRLRNSRS